MNAIDLTSLAAVKRRAEVSSANDDAEISSAITAFSQHLLTFTGRATLNSIESFDEFYDGKGNNVLFLACYPITAVTAVNMNGVSIPQSTSWQQWGWLIERTRRSIALRGGIGQFSTFPYPTTYISPYRYGKGPVFLPGKANIEVAYQAGYPPSLVQNDIETIAAQTVTLAQEPWVADGGVVFYPSLVPLTEVPNSPLSGQYAVLNGLYVFNAADNGKQVALSYTASLAPPDLEYAVRCVVALNYKRKGWQDQESRSVTSQGMSATTRYRDWAWPPEYDRVFESYQRKALV